MYSDLIHEIEVCFLGAIIASDSAFYKSRRLKASDFVLPVHGEIYGNICQRYDQKKAVEARLIAIDFSTHPDLSDVGGGKYIIDLANSLISAMAAPDYAEQIHQAAAARKNRKIQEVEIIRMDSVELKRVDWLWPKRIACGKITVIAGNPGLGKSQITASIAAIITKPMEWPGTEELSRKGNVVFLSAEDDAADTIKPRLMAACADLCHCHIITAVKADGYKMRSFDLKQDIERLAAAIEAIDNVRLIVIDPISAYLGGTDSYKDADVRGLLMPLSDMAARYNVAIILVAHFNKSNQQDPIARVGGSIGLIAAARAGYAVIKDDDRPEIRFFVPLKNNIGNDHDGFSFQIEEVALEQGINTSRIRWNADPVDAKKVLSQKSGDNQTITDGAIIFLQDALATDAKMAKELLQDADHAGYSKAVIQRAANKIGVVRKKDGMKGGWIWSLPSWHDQIVKDHKDSSP